jgi:hypothetical protein
VSEEECKRIFKNLTYLSAKKRSFLEGKAKQSKAKQRRRRDQIPSISHGIQKVP